MNLQTIKTELKEYILDRVQDYDTETIAKLTRDNELHHELFNTDYYIIGYYQCEQWLKEHNISVFEGIEFVQNYERNQFGVEAVQTYDNAEKLVNMITYIIGEELIYTMQDEIEILICDTPEDYINLN
tara:strand:- start:683 stop:1066 length:384 start_codon:yes stop_codon:yes gene_type:complete